MDPQKWEKAKLLYQSALKVGREDRSRYLIENCSSDEELLREVESLLEYADEAEGFLEKPAIGEVAEALLAERSLAGKTILHYELIELLGSGGMGEVYLAEDTKMKRKIALKILPASMSEDSTFVRRFEREALAASGLNHPNILTVYEFGQTDGMKFIACEFVKGETLRDRLNRDSELTLSWKLDCALQVASALRAAHQSNIIHRDIKPENVMIRDDGFIKVLDFGLAKLVFPENEPVNADEDTVMRTTPGLVMGTVAYMSPEQARGGQTDSRTDIWSLGVVLYEMVTGKLPYGGETASDRIASILTSDPALSENIPPELNRILKTALEKEAADRYQHIGDLIRDLEAFRREDTAEIFTTGTRMEATKITAGSLPASNTLTMAAPRQHPSNAKWTILIGALLIVLGGAYGAYRYFSGQRYQPAANLLDSKRIKTLFNWDAEPGEGSTGSRFSPNGGMIAYSLMKNGQRNIWTKQVPDGKSNQVTDGRSDNFDPIWSPDGQRLAFVSSRDNQKGILTIPFSGGPVTLIKPMEENEIRLMSWSGNGEKIYFSSSEPQGGLNVFALDIASRQVVKITNFDSSASAQFFSISPTEDRIAYSSGPNEERRIFVMPIGGGPPTQVTNDSSSDESPIWLPDGNRIIYSSKRAGVYQACMAYLDEKRTEQINLGSSDTLVSDVSRDGNRILFQQSREESDLWKVGTSDKRETQLTFDPALEMWPDLSPDGTSMVYQAPSESKHVIEGPIYIRPLDDDDPISISGRGFSPAFSPDGRMIAFLRDADKLINLWVVSRTGSVERQVTNSGVSFPGYVILPFNRTQVKDFSWSPDSSSLIYCAKMDGRWNIWQSDINGGEPRRISNNTDENVRLYGPVFNKDGKQIAWTSAPVKPSADGKRTASVFLWNEEAASLIYSSDTTIKLIGWAGNDLVIAMTGEKITAKHAKTVLMRIMPDGQTRDMATVDVAYFDNIRLSADGRRIAIAERQDGKDNILVISATSGERARITSNTDPSYYVSSIAWAPDGKSIYFGKQKKAGTISMIENFK